MNFTFEQQGFIGILKFYADISSRRNVELTEALMVSLDNTDYLVVNLHNVTVSDCSSLKPILSARRVAAKQNKSLKLIGVNNETLKCAEEFKDSCRGYLTSIYGGWSPEFRKENLDFFKGEGFITCSQLAGTNRAKQYRILRMLEHSESERRSSEI